ncbi:hypothetical protein [Gloeocapsopsis dulcis]|uniref:hypothetical protein n=1 Tax=Gloeocapsopsis dulcis TaxID=2859516 RepID=UPI0018C6D7BF|nr:hypothetical protein [Gloeocapsopsis dulcis]WNN90064.1 hypothetical protein P0S91_02890 [Gloeocapsopsis dulcis]
MTDSKAVRYQAMIKSHFPEAIVEVPDELVAVMTNHPNDRHVVAAAMVAKVKIIVTTNLKHFPQEILAPFGIEAQHPDVFLTNLQKQFPALMLQLIQQQSQDLKNPPVSVDELLTKLNKQVPEFVSQVQLTLQSID